MIVKHKFLDKYPITGKKILIIGTFNPDIICNEATFFYSRRRNYFWDLLPSVFDSKLLKDDSVEEKISFLKINNIELTDLILSVDISEEDVPFYGDDKLNNVLKWNTDNILNVLKKNNTQEVYFTRKSFDKKVENIKNEIYKIKGFCEENNIKFKFLPTPARYKNEKKSKEWKVKFERQDIDLGT
jgi:G:T/U-mismatch repair DNA glycosylase